MKRGKSDNWSMGSRKKLTAIDYVLFAILLLFAITIIVPFWNVLTVSFSTQKEATENPLMLFPSDPTLENYRYLFNDGKFVVGFKNTIVLLLVGVPLALFLTTTMGYALSKRYFPGRKLILYLVTFTMIFNGGIVPTYLVLRQLGLIGSLWAVVFTNCFSVFNLILMINYFQTIPPALIESATLDGAGEGRTIISIIIPLSKPILATITLFYGVGYWNQWYDSMIFIRQANKLPLQNVLRSLIQNTEIVTTATSSLAALGQSQYSDGIKMAAVILTMVPVVCFFPLLQKHFTKGIMVGSIK